MSSDGVKYLLIVGTLLCSRCQLSTLIHSVFPAFDSLCIFLYPGKEIYIAVISCIPFAGDMSAVGDFSFFFFPSSF